MKKILPIALALALVLSLGVSAFAEVTVDGETKIPDKSGTVNIFVQEAHSVTLNAENDMLVINTLDGVNGEGETSAVNASKGIAIVSLRVSQSGSADAIVAKDGADVAVRFFEVKETGTGSAINASGSGTKVAIDGSLGSVEESGNGNAINASDGANVNITLDVTEKDNGDAINASGADTKVIVGRNVTENGDGNAITADGGAKVIVGGNAAGHIVALNDATVIVEGTAEGAIHPDGESDVFIGNLDGTIDSDLLDCIHYLIGTADGSEEIGDNIIIKDATEAVVGASGKTYYGTINGTPVILKSNVSGKQIEITGLSKGSSYDPSTGKLTLGKGFTGGLQNLKLVLVEIPAPGPAPVYYLVPAGSVTTASVKLPEGVAEGLIKALDSSDHAGITVDSSLAGDGSVKVLKGDEELSAKDFNIYTHADGSVDFILSNTYLYALGSGSYDFTAIVGGMKIDFSVVVAV